MIQFFQKRNKTRVI